MLIPAAFSLVVTDGHALAFGLPSLGALIFGAALFSFTRNPATYISGRDVFLMVVLGWLRVATVGSLPFVLSGLMGPANAFFESMVGFTTTGASTVP
jgi:trk system potassium uptake protein TrkH